MQKTLKLGWAAFAGLVVLACSLVQPNLGPATDVPTSLVAPLETAPAGAPTSAGSEAAPAGVRVSFTGGSLVIPEGLASGASAETIAAVADQGGGPWEVAPEYVKVKLEGYALQDEFFQPQIMMYPAAEYAATNQAAANSIQLLQAILANPSTPLSKDTLPHLPFANAAQVFAAQMQLVSFEGGQGVRALTEYAQYVAPINNHDMFYHFEGLTADGKFYVIGILPVNASFLAPGSDPASPIPAGGVPFPGYETSDESQFESYYQTIIDMLNATPSDQFQPTLTALDALIQSLEVSP